MAKEKVCLAYSGGLDTSCICMILLEIYSVKNATDSSPYSEISIRRGLWRYLLYGRRWPRRGLQSCQGEGNTDWRGKRSTSKI